MSETTNEDRMYPIEMTLQGARCCISIGKGVIKALGKPSHVSIKISDSHDSLSVFPCDEDDVMAFRVPLKLFTDHRCVMRINSKQFVHGIMRTNQMDTSKTYVLSGEFLEEKGADKLAAIRKRNFADFSTGFPQFCWFAAPFLGRVSGIFPQFFPQFHAPAHADFGGIARRKIKPMQNKL